MAAWFGCDPQLASTSSSTLAQIRDQIDPSGQWLDGIDAVGVPGVTAALGDFAGAATGASEELSTRVGGASDLLGTLAAGTQDVDESLLGQLGLL